MSVSETQTNKEFLNWIADRLTLVYGDKEGYDFIRRLRGIAAGQDETVDNAPTYNGEIWEERALKAEEELGDTTNRSIRRLKEIDFLDAELTKAKASSASLVKAYNAMLESRDKAESSGIKSSRLAMGRLGVIEGLNKSISEIEAKLTKAEDAAHGAGVWVADTQATITSLKSALNEANARDNERVKEIATLEAKLGRVSSDGGGADLIFGLERIASVNKERANEAEKLGDDLAGILEWFISGPIESLDSKRVEKIAKEYLSRWREAVK